MTPDTHLHDLVVKAIEAEKLADRARILADDARVLADDAALELANYSARVSRPIFAGWQCAQIIPFPGRQS